ncbi:137_t:CDS:1, partial [Acaulospora morrowiae]
DDRKSLYSCLRVNRFWCRNSVPILWRQPFEKRITKKGGKIIQAYLSSLDDHEKLSLAENGIDVSNLSRPLFDYPIFLENLKYRYYIGATIDWVMTDKNIGSVQKRQVYQINTALCRLFMRKCVNLKSMVIETKNYCLEFPELSTFTSIQPGLSKLTKFIYHVRFHFNSNFLEQTIQLLENFPTLCTSLQYLEVMLISFKGECKVAEAISKIIQAQKHLEEIRILCSGNFGASIVPAIKHHADKLISIQINVVKLDETTLQVLSTCEKLENLSLGFDDALTMENIKYLLCSNIRLKKLNILSLDQISSEVVNSMIQKGGKSLQYLWLCFTTSEIVESTIKHCPNLVSLTIDVSMADEEQLCKLICSFKLVDLTIYGAGYGLGGILSFIKYSLPMTLIYLHIDLLFYPSELEDFLQDFEIPLRTLILDKNITFDNSYLEVMIKYLEKRKTLRYLGVSWGTIFGKDGLEGVLRKLNDEFGVHVISCKELDGW